MLVGVGCEEVRHRVRAGCLDPPSPTEDLPHGIGDRKLVPVDVRGLVLVGLLPGRRGVEADRPPLSSAGTAPGLLGCRVGDAWPWSARPRGGTRRPSCCSEWAAHRDLFPHQPSRTRFNRRRRQLQGAINELRRLLLALLDLAQDRRCVLDSLPIPVIAFHLVPGANRADWQAYEARFGRVPSKKITIFGYKLYLLVTLSGVILDFLLAPANVGELQAGVELLDEHTDLTTLGDKAFISQAVAARLRAENRVQLLTLPRRNAQQQLPPAGAAACSTAPARSSRRSTAN